MANIIDTTDPGKAYIPFKADNKIGDPSEGYIPFIANKSAAVDPLLREVGARATAESSRPHAGEVVTRSESGQQYDKFGSYDNMLQYSQNQAYVRGANQSVAAQAVNGVVNLIPSTILKTVGGMGALVGGIGGLFTADGFAKGAAENAFSRALADADNYIKQEVLPVYASRKYIEGNTVDKLFTSSWLFNDLADGVAFAASAFLGAKGIGAVTEGMSLTKALAKYEASSYLSKAVAEGIHRSGVVQGLEWVRDWTGVGTQQALAGVYNTIFEAASEGHDSGKKVKDYYNTKIQIATEQGNTKLAADLAHQRDIASDAAISSTFAANAMLLGFTNTLLEAKWFLGSASKTSNGLRNAVLSDAFEIGEKNATQAALKPSSKLGALAKGIGGESYVEENVQAAIQDRYFDKYALGKDSENKRRGDFAYIMSRSMDNAMAFTGNVAAAALRAGTLGALNIQGLQTTAGSSEDEASNAMFAALAIGGSMSMKHAFSEDAENKKFADEFAPIAKTYYNMAKLGNQFMVDNITENLKETKDENGNIVPVFGPDGKAVIDPDKAGRMTRRVRNILDSHRIALQTAAEDDKVGFERNKAQALSEYVYFLGTQLNGITKDDFKFIIDNHPAFEPKQEGKEIGHESLVEDNKEKAMKLFDDLQSIRNKHSNPLTITDPNNMTDEQRDQVNVADALVRTEYFVRSAKDALSTAISVHDDEVLSHLLDSHESDDAALEDKSPLMAGHYKDLQELNSTIKDLNKGSKSLTRKIVEDEVIPNLRYNREVDTYIAEDAKLEKKITESKDEAERIALAKEREELQSKILKSKYELLETNTINGLKSVKYPGSPDDGGYTYSSQRKVAEQRAYKADVRKDSESSSSIIESIAAKQLASTTMDNILSDVKDLPIEEQIARTKDNVAAISTVTQGSEELLRHKRELEATAKEYKQQLETVRQAQTSLTDVLENMINGHQQGATADEIATEIPTEDHELTNPITNQALTVVTGGEPFADANDLISKAYNYLTDTNIESVMQDLDYILARLNEKAEKLKSVIDYNDSIDESKINDDLKELKLIEDDKKGFMVREAFSRINADAVSLINTYLGDDVDPILKDSLIDDNAINNAIIRLEGAKESFKLLTKNTEEDKGKRTDIPEDLKKSLLNDIQVLEAGLNTLKGIVQANLKKMDAENNFYQSTKLNALLSAISVDVNGNLEDPEIENTLNAILNPLGKNIKDEISFIFSNPSPYPIALALFHLLKTSTANNPELRKSLNELIDTQKKVVKTKLKAGGSTTKYLANPARRVRQYLSTQVGDKEMRERLDLSGNTKGSAAFYLKQHHNLYGMLFRLRDDTALTKEDKAYINDFIKDVHLPLLGLNAISDVLDATYSFKEFSDLIEQVPAKYGINLSEQQFVAIVDIINFLNKEGITEDALGYGIYLSGTLGSGKSTITGIAMDIHRALNKDSKVLAVAHTATASKNINQKINGTTSTDELSISDLTVDHLSDIDILVVDEAAAMSNNAIKELDKLVKATNVATKSKLRVVFVGDPSQIKVEANPVIITDAANDSNIDSHNLNHTAPLGSIYRTSIEAISNVLLQFKDETTPINSVDGYGTTSMSKYDSTALGVVPVDTEIVNFLAKRSPVRSAVAITNTVEQANDLATKITMASGKTLAELNLKVLSYYDAQSITEDEAYVLIDKDGVDIRGNKFSTPEFNTAMYTSIGRATKFVAISPAATIVSFKTNSSMSDTIDVGDKTREALKVGMEKIIDNLLKGLERYFGEKRAPKKSKPEGATPGDKEEDEIEFEFTPLDDPSDHQGDNYDDDIVESDLDYDEEAHPYNLKYPNNNNIRKRLQAIKNGTVTDKSIHIIKAVDPSKNGLQATQYIAVAQLYDNVYIPVATLGGDDINDPEFNSTFNNFKDVPSIPINRIKDEGFQMSDDIKDSVAHTAHIAYLNKLTYSYNPESERSTKVEDLVRLWANGFFQNPEEEAAFIEADGSINLSDKYFSIDIMTPQLEDILHLNERGWTKVPYGNPVLLIKNYRRDSQTPDVHFIELSNTVANINDAWYDQNVVPVQNTALAGRALMNFFEDRPPKNGEATMALGNRVFNGIVDKFARNAYNADPSGIHLVQDPVSVIQDVLKSDPTYAKSIDTKDAQELVKLLDDFIKTLYTSEKSAAIIKESEVADFIKLHGEDLNFDSRFTAKSGQTFVKVRFTDDAGDLVPYEVHKPSLGESVAQKRINSLSRVFAKSPFKGANITTTKRYGKTELTVGKSIMTTDQLENPGGMVAAQMRWMIIGDDRAVDPSIAAQYPEFVGRKGKTDYIIQDFKDKYGEAVYADVFLKARDAVRVPMTIMDLEAIASIERGKAVTLDNGKPIRNNISLSDVTNIGSAKGYTNNKVLTNPKFKEFIESNTTTSFSQVVRNSIYISSGAQASRATSLTDKVNEARGNESRYQRIQPNMASITESHPLHEVYKIVKDHIDNMYFYSLPGLKEGMNTTVKGLQKFTDSNPDLPDVRIAIGEANNLSHPRVSELLLHEAIHGLTLNALYRGSNDIGTKAETAFAKRIIYLKDIFDMHLADNNISPRDIYTKTISNLDEFEFIANLANPVMVAEMKKVKVSKGNVFEEIFKSILKLFGVGETNVYEAALKSLEDLLAPGSNSLAELVATDNNDQRIQNLADKIQTIEDEFDRRIYENRLKAIAINPDEAKISKLESDLINRLGYAVSNINDASQGSMQNLVQRFGSTEVARIAKFVVQKGIYEQMNSSKYPLSYSEAYDQVFADIRTTGISEIIKELNQELGQADSITLSTIKNKLDDLRREYINLTENHPGNTAAIDKIGEEYSNLNIIYNKYQPQIEAIKRLSSDKAATKNYNAIIKSIFSDWYFVEEDAEKGITLTDEEFAEISGITKEVADSEETNPLKSLSTGIKTYLTLIPTFTNGKISGFVSPRQAKTDIIELLYRHVNLRMVEPGLLDVLNNIKNNNLVTRATSALLDKLSSTVTDALATTYMDANQQAKAFPKNVSIFVDSFNSFERPKVHLIRSTSDKDVRGKLPDEAKYHFDKDVDVKTYDSFLDLIKDSTISGDLLVKLYKKSVAMDQIASINNSVGSLMKVDYMQGVSSVKRLDTNEQTEDGRSVKSSNKSFRYELATGYSILNKASSIINLTMSDLMLGNIINEKGIPVNFKSTFFIENIKNNIFSSDIKKNALGVNNFLRLIGLADVTTSLNVTSPKYEKIVASIAQNFKKFYNDVYNSAYKGTLDSYATSTEDEKAEIESDLLKVLKDNSSVKQLTAEIKKLVGLVNEVRSVDSIISGDNKKVYINIPTSSFREVMKYLSRYHNPKLSNELHLNDFFSSEFMSQNIFVKGLNKVYDYNPRHESIISGSYSTPAVRNSKPQLLEREFAYQFIASLAGSKPGSKKHTYHQPIYQQGEAHKSESPLVGFLDAKQVKGALAEMYRQTQNLDNNLITNTKYNTGDRLNFSVLNNAFKSGTEFFSEQELVDHMFDQLVLKAKELATYYAKNNLSLPYEINHVYDLLKESYGEYTQAPDKLAETGEFKTTGAKLSQNVYPAKAAMEAMFLAYVANRYVNSFGLSQIAYGDFNLYKSIDDVVKRAQGSASPGSLSIIHDEYGMPERANVFIAKDTSRNREYFKGFLEQFDTEESPLKSMDDILSKITSYDQTDGVSFVTPRYYYKMQKGFGSSFNLKNIIKDQYFGYVNRPKIDPKKEFETEEEAKKAYPKNQVVEKDGKYYVVTNQMEQMMLKNSIAVLTPTLTKAHPMLDKLRLWMDSPKQLNKPIDILVYGSGNKIGNPANISTKPFGEDESGKETFELDNAEEGTIESHMREIDNRLFKMQYNPFSKDHTTALPRQITHLINTLGVNPEATRIINSAILGLQETGFINKFGSKVLTEGAVKSYLTDKISKGSENYVISTLLQHGMPMDHPAIASRSIIAFGSALEKATVGIRINGGKLVLASPEGYTNPKTGKPLRILKHANGGPVAEALVPRSYLDANMLERLDSGKDIDSLLDVPVMMGFRIPSSGLNAAVAIKIVGTYDDANATNVIVLPDNLIPIQGWDFDIDSLFILMPEHYKENTFVNGKLYTTKQYVGFNADGTSNFEATEKELITHLNTLNSQLATATDSGTKEERAEIRKDIKAASAIRTQLYKNMLFHSYTEVVVADRNKDRVLDIISIKPIEDAIDHLKAKGLYTENTNQDLSLFEDNAEKYQDVNNSEVGIGIYAKGMNVDSYTMKAGIDSKPPTLHKGLTFTLNDELVNQLSEYIDVFGKELDIYNLKSSLLNGFLDAIKNPEIFTIGFYGDNANLVDTMISLKGIKFADIVTLFNNPKVRSLFRDGKFTKVIAEYYDKEVTKTEDTKKAYDELNVNSADLVAAYEGEKLDPKIMSLLHKIYTISSKRRAITTFVNTGMRLPVSLQQMYQYLDRMASIFDMKKLNAILDEVSYDTSETVSENLDIFSKIDTPIDPEFGIDLPNLFKENPQIVSAVKRVLELNKIIEKEFAIYSAPAKRLAFRSMPMSLDTQEAAQNKINALHSLSDTVVSSIAEDLNYRSTSLINGNVYNGVRGFIEDLAARIAAVDKVEALMKANNPDYPKNKIMQHLIADKSYVQGMSTIRVGDGFNISSYEIEEYQQQFRELAKYNFTFKDGKYKANPTPVTERITEFQLDLIKYAAITNGLRPATTNYVAMIAPELLKYFTDEIKAAYKNAITENKDLNTVGDIHDIIRAVKDPSSIRSWASLNDSIVKVSKVNDNLTEEQKQLLVRTERWLKETDGDFEARKTQHYATVLRHENSINIFPKVYVSNEYAPTNDKKEIFVLKAIDDIEGVGVLAYYDKVSYGPTTSMSKPYILQNHYRSDLRSYPAIPTLDYDIHVTGTEWSEPIKENRRFYNSIKNNTPIPQYIYMFYKGDAARHRLSLVEVTNFETAKQDGKANYKTIEGDIAYNNTPSQEEFNKQEIKLSDLRIGFSNDFSAIFDPEVIQEAEIKKINCK